MDSNPVAARPNRFLEALPPAQRAQLERLASPKEFRPGDVLFQEGTEHDDLYLLLEGHVRLEMFVRDRGRMPIMTAGPGDLVGWSPLFSGHPMTATASALESVRDNLPVNARKIAEFLLGVIGDGTPEITVDQLTEYLTSALEYKLDEQLAILGKIIKQEKHALSKVGIVAFHNDMLTAEDEPKANSDDEDD